MTEGWSNIKLIIVLAAAGSFLILPGALTAAEVKLSEATQACIECHQIIHPGIVADWQRSRHAQVTPKAAMAVTRLGLKVSSASVPEELRATAVGCAECHTLRAKEHADTYAHDDAIGTQLGIALALLLRQLA